MFSDIFSHDVTTSKGISTIYWLAAPMYWSQDLTKGYVITDIHGYEFPEPYFGKLFHLCEVGSGVYEYVEDIAKKESQLDDDSRLILETVKHQTVKQVKH